MAVFTHVPENELRKFLLSYDIGDLEHYVGIEEGVENTNYYMRTTKGEYILTLFESRIRGGSLPFCFQFMKHLHANDISCPTVIKDVQGYETRMFCSRPASIINFVQGRPIASSDITAAHCKNMGAYQAAMHNAAKGFEAYRENPMGFNEWHNLYCKTASKADTVQEGLADLLIGTLVDIREEMPTKLPSGAIHADLFPDNVFFIDDKVSAVIDFYFACNDFFLYDACLTFNAWCSNTDFSINEEKACAFWQGYKEVRSLTSLEHKYFPLVRKAAALRILMTRLHDWVFPPEEENVILTPKNPEEYIVKLQWSDKQVADLLD